MKKIAVFSSGGDAPGMNAAIRAVVRTANHHDLEVYGIYRGYQGLIEGDIKKLTNKDMANIIHRGGTVLKTARSKEFMTVEGRRKAHSVLEAYGIDGLIAIGGNGTLTGAKVFMEEYDFPIVGLPGTIDNDLYGTDLTIGFDTAVNTAIEAVDKIRDTADSHNRIFFIEVMGRHAGFIALNTGIGSGASDILIPEEMETMDELISALSTVKSRRKLFNLVIVAEGSGLGDIQEVAKQVQEKFPEREIRVAIIGHLQRGGSPTAIDRVLSSRLGYAAVNAMCDGKKGVMLGIKNGEISEVPFEDAIHKQKRVRADLLQVAKVLAS